MRQALSNSRLIGIFAFVLQLRISSPHFQGADARGKPWKASPAHKNKEGREITSPSSTVFDLVLETIALGETPVEDAEIDNRVNEDGQAPHQQKRPCFEAADTRIWDVEDVLDFWFGGSALDNMKTRCPTT
jgi:hypothetical protein